jgi:hypothetical protein
LHGVWEIVGGRKDQPQVEFDIDKLDNKTLLKLVEYVKDKDNVKISNIKLPIERKSP